MATLFDPRSFGDEFDEALQGTSDVLKEVASDIAGGQFHLVCLGISKLVNAFLFFDDKFGCSDFSVHSRLLICEGNGAEDEDKPKAKAKAKAKPKAKAEDQSWKEYAKASEDVVDPAVKKRCMDRQRKDKRRSEFAKKRGAKSVP